MDDTYTGNTHILQTQLEKYVRQGLYPLHMPGHKRLMQPAPGLPSSWDLTEVEGTDDLHDAGGILSDAMRRTALLWGAERTWYLVNGSTCGLLAAIRSLAGHGAEVICARNCHKAVFHAIGLSGYRVRWLMPAVNEEWGICGGISALQVQAALGRYPSAKAVILTSPTYEGILSDIKGICRVCHEKGIPVLVDEAHGAHLMPLSAASGFPAGALAGGADLVVQSPHKTLPSLTQTALLHLQGRIADPARVEEELDIFETSSPSYPLMASLDGCTGILRKEGAELFKKWKERLARFDEAVHSLQKIRILGHGSQSAAVNDPGKILINTRGAGMTGQEAAGLLRDQFRLETEYARGFHVLAMSSPCDSEDALDRLAAALLVLDTKAAAPVSVEKNRTDSTDALPVQELLMIRPVTACTIACAAEQEAEEVPITEASGRICAEYLYDYPPGIPFLIPGEFITRKIIEILEKEAENGRAFYGHRGREGVILCLRE